MPAVPLAWRGSCSNERWQCCMVDTVVVSALRQHTHRVGHGLGSSTPRLHRPIAKTRLGGCMFCDSRP